MAFVSGHNEKNKIAQREEDSKICESFKARLIQEGAGGLAPMLVGNSYDELYVSGIFPGMNRFCSII